MEIIKVAEKVGFSDTFMPRILKVTPDYKVPLICLKTGQSIPPHASGTGIFYILSGAGIMTVGSEKNKVTAGDMVIVDKGAERGIEATEDLTAFAVHLG